jgi:hypothetical protein
VLKNIDRPEHLDVTLDDDAPGHDDLVLRIGSYVHRCDTYYLAIDPDNPCGDGSVASALAHLLDQWLRFVSTAERSDLLFLPIDFSDECTAWLRCTLEDEAATIHFGWSSIEGYSFNPSSIEPRVRNVPDFEPLDEAPPVRLGRSELEVALRDLVAKHRNPESTPSRPMEGGAPPLNATDGNGPKSVS